MKYDPIKGTYEPIKGTWPPMKYEPIKGTPPPPYRPAPVKFAWHELGCGGPSPLTCFMKQVLPVLIADAKPKKESTREEATETTEAN